jgi:hypothetical protein
MQQCQLETLRIQWEPLIKYPLGNEINHNDSVLVISVVPPLPVISRSLVLSR